MDQKLRRELNEYYKAPQPVRKQEFIRSHKQTKVNNLHIILKQCSYISIATWCFSFTFFIVSLLLGNFIPDYMLATIYSLIPFLVMVSIIECVRSSIYGMSELEMSTRFSLKSILMMRMIILGIGNIVLLLLIILFNNTLKWHNLIYMFVPYLATAFGSLKILRSHNIKESSYICAGFAMFISLLCFIVSARFQYVYEFKYISSWIIACFILLYLTIYEGYRTIRMTEDLQWN